MDGFSLDNKVAIVTGASRGIGRAIALRFAQAGARVVLAGRKVEGLEAVCDEIGAAGGQALPVATHIGHADEVQALVRHALDAYGGLHIVVNNAATNPHFGQVLTADDGQWLKTFDTNVLGLVRLCRAAVPHMEGAGGGKIVNVASIAGLRPSPGMGLYGVSKAAIIALTQQLAFELGPANIQVNAIAPGVIKTRFSTLLWQTPAISEPILSRTPLGRFGEPEDIAGLALYLASPAADFVTGAVFVIDGGLNVAPVMGV